MFQTTLLEVVQSGKVARICSKLFTLLYTEERRVWPSEQASMRTLLRHSQFERWPGHCPLSFLGQGPEQIKKNLVVTSDGLACHSTTGVEKHQKLSCLARQEACKVATLDLQPALSCAAPLASAQLTSRPPVWLPFPLSFSM